MYFADKLTDLINSTGLTNEQISDIYYDLTTLIVKHTERKTNSNAEETVENMLDNITEVNNFKLVNDTTDVIIDKKNPINMTVLNDLLRDLNLNIIIITFPGSKTNPIIHRNSINGISFEKIKTLSRMKFDNYFTSAGNHDLNIDKINELSNIAVISNNLKQIIEVVSVII